MVIAADALAPPQVTVTVPVPGRVRDPMFHDQDTAPSPAAVLVDNPCAVLFVPAGVM
jgi:hypothetical protein